jgi:hypothetical protein
MKVKELVELLSGCDAEARVVFTTQPNWPLEYEVAGLATRDDCRDELGSIQTGAARALNDVILVEGAQLGYGEREAWSAARARLRRR